MQGALTGLKSTLDLSHPWLVGQVWDFLHLWVVQILDLFQVCRFGWFRFGTFYWCDRFGWFRSGTFSNFGWWVSFWTCSTFGRFRSATFFRFEFSSRIGRSSSEPFTRLQGTYSSTCPPFSPFAGITLAYEPSKNQKNKCQEADNVSSICVNLAT